MQKVKISIACCTYNGEQYLLEQLLSIASQTRTPDELVICDDGSTDRTIEMVENFALAASFKVKLYKNDGQSLGSTKNFEKAIGLCLGEMIVLSDQDDVWMPNKLAILEQAIDSGAGLVFSDAELVNERLEPLGYTLFDSLGLSSKEKNEISHNLFFDILMRRNIVTGAAAAFSSRHLSLILPISNHWVHDGWIALLIASIDKVAIINQPLFKYRQHSKNQIGSRKLNFREKIQLSRKLGNKHYLELLNGFKDVKGILKTLPANDSHTYLLRRIDHKIDHLRVRTRITKKSAWVIFSLINELISGRYHQFSRGWISFFRDINMMMVNIIDS